MRMVRGISDMLRLSLEYVIKIRVWTEKSTKRSRSIIFKHQHIRSIFGLCMFCLAWCVISSPSGQDFRRPEPSSALRSTVRGGGLNLSVPMSPSHATNMLRSLSEACTIVSLSPAKRLNVEILTAKGPGQRVCPETQDLESKCQEIQEAMPRDPRHRRCLRSRFIQ